MNNPPLCIASALFPDDREAVISIFRDYQRFLGADLLESKPHSFEAEMAGLPGKYAPPRGNILLARQGNTIVGCVAWYPFDEGICEIKRLYVRPDQRGRGLGKKLLAQAVETARATEYRAIYMDSLERLEDAKKLYESFGFRRIPPFNDCPLPDIYHMQLDLAA